ncbi:MAG: YdcF family protein [Anaerolineales bacterium]|nr:MAG: YdcF family protein [Anaerolineales bacterium]
MLENVAEFFKLLLIPGSATFFVLGLILAVLLLFSGRRAAKWGRRWLLFLAVLGYLLSTPLVASSLQRGISLGYSPLDTEVIDTEVEAVVVLGGGGATFRLGSDEVNMLSEQSVLRLLEGLRLYRALSPEWVIVSGGPNARAGVSTPESETMGTLLIELGIPPERILIERQSKNTHDQAVNIPPLLARHAVERFVLVTSPTHMRRADLSFRAESTQHLTSTAPAMSETTTPLGWSPFPSSEALETSRDVFRELVGLLYYFLRGWI